MADAKRCDICERYYMPYEGKKKLNNFYFDICSLRGIKTDKHGSTELIDLCPDCFSKIAHAMEERQEESDTSEKRMIFSKEYLFMSSAYHCYDCEYQKVNIDRYPCDRCLSSRPFFKREVK